MSRYDRDESPDEIRDSGAHRPTESLRLETSDAKGRDLRIGGPTFQITRNR